MTEEQLQERYKHIEVEKQGDIIIVKLYRSENIDDKIYFVRIIFVDNKLFYSGDMGTYVFGKDIVNIFSFFKGNKTNVGYWAGKCETSSYPIFPNEVDEDIVEEKVKEYLCDFFGVENFDELDDETKDIFSDMFRFGIETNDIRAYDKVYEFLEEHFNQPNLGEYVYHIIEGAKETSGNFVYACEVIQWVENNLEKWLGEK